MATLVEALRRPRGSGYGGILGWITTVDHKRIGLLYGGTSILFLLIGGLEAMLIRVQLAKPENSFVTPEVYNQIFTMHGLTMIFFAVMPLSAAFFNYLVPLQIGARDVAFPRLNALSFWLFLFSGFFLYSSFLVGGAPDAGWFAYANLTSNEFSKGTGMDFYALGLQVAGVSSIMSALNFATTIINLRAPGMTWMRMPVFVWTTLVTAILMLLAFPALTVALILLTFDRLFGTHFYIPAAGADPVLWQHFFWIFGHPEVYILILPAFGIISEIIPVFSRKPLFGYPFVVMSTIAIGILGFGVWAHHMFAVGLGPIADSAFAIVTMLIAVPTGVKTLNWLATLVGGSLNLKTPMYYALGFIAMFTVGGLSGVMHASPPADLQQTDSYFVVAHLHYVLFGGSLFGLMGGIYYWFPKFAGVMLHDGIGKVQFWIWFVGFNLTFFPMHLLGLDGMPRRIYTYAPGMGWDVANLIETVGAFILAISILLFLFNLYYSFRNPERAPADPWDGATLEWSIPSPPPAYNFEVVPTVRSRDALWALKYGNQSAEGAAAQPQRVPEPQPDLTVGAVEQHGQLASDADIGHAPAQIHMPLPSFLPIVVALGLTLFAAGLIPGSTLALSALGASLGVFGIYGMFVEPIEAHGESH